MSVNTAAGDTVSLSPFILYVISIAVIMYLITKIRVNASFRMFVFFQAENGIREAQESRGLGDVYKRQVQNGLYIRMALLAAVLGQA